LSRKTPDLAHLLAAIDPTAPLAQRHLQLIALLGWVRGDGSAVEAATGRVALLVEAAERAPDVRARLQAWWAALAQHLDLRDAIHVGHSTGGGEAARYVARHGKGRVARACPVS